MTGVRRRTPIRFMRGTAGSAPPTLRRVTSAPPRTDPVPTTPVRSRAVRGLAVVAVAAAVLAVWLSGRQITRDGGDLRLRDGYVVGGPFDVVLSARILLPVALAAAVVLWGPALARRLGWPAAAGREHRRGRRAGRSRWRGTAAGARSPQPMASRARVRRRRRPGGRDLGTFLVHLRRLGAGGLGRSVGHPRRPGTRRARCWPSCSSTGSASAARAGPAALCIVGGALAVPAVLVTVRVVADEAAARAVAPFAVLLPGCGLDRHESPTRCSPA